jgi:hypothetical protein
MLVLEGWDEEELGTHQLKPAPALDYASLTEQE